MENLGRTWTAIGYTLGGFVAGEAWFGTKRRSERFVTDGSPRLAFVFAVAVAQRDEGMLRALRAYLGTGVITQKPPREPHHQPISEFTIASLRSHRAATIPFAYRFLLPCEKRRQFERWVASMETYEAQRRSRSGRGPSPCSVPGCGRPVRGRGLCRSHYYRATGY
jgi:hypothetical protein